MTEKPSELPTLPLPSATAAPTSPDAQDSDDKPVSETASDWIETFTAQPTDARAELVHRICDRVAGGELLRDIARDKGMPSRATFDRWCKSCPQIALEYGIAQKLRCEDIIEEIIATARNGDGDFVEEPDPDNDGVKRVVLSKEAVVQRALKINTLDRMLARIWPRRFGTGGEGVIIEAQAIEPPRDGAAARDLGNVIVLENRVPEDHPMRDEILNWKRIAEEATKR